MSDLNLITSRPEPAQWYGRLDVAEALKAAGWSDDDGELLEKDGAFWSVTSEADDSTLACPNDAVIDFPRSTPADVIIAACLSAAASQ
ncbi:hypothetical protein [Streptomyces chartreusis]|uniref:hypothetical protein n=1 Tax=Streptomyces chartreusis TaxID=1969 RepID=UPI0037F2FD02